MCYEDVFQGLWGSTGSWYHPNTICNLVNDIQKYPVNGIMPSIVYNLNVNAFHPTYCGVL